MTRFIAFLALAASMLPLSVSAEDYDTRTLMRRGQWQVDVTYSASADAFWCTAGTENSLNQRFNLVAYQNEGFALFVFDPRWSLEPRAVRFLVDIDRSRWTIDGTGEGVGISLNMTDAETAVKFLVQLKRGNTAYVYNDRQQQQASFSLSGSSAAIDALFDCWDRITGTPDPF